MKPEAPDLSAEETPYRSFPDFDDWGELPSRNREIWAQLPADLEAKRREARPEDLAKAVDVAVRAAAVDTAAIEGLYDADRGFTMSVAVQTAAWEQAFAEKGEKARRFFDAQLQALELVLDAVTEERPITEKWTRELHVMLCEPQTTYPVFTEQGWQDRPLPKGRYKIHPNNPTRPNGTQHAYAPPDQVPIEMHRLVEQIHGSVFHDAHPVLQASYVHYVLAAIHPFADGNGRVARALASTFFYKAHSIPLLVFADQRPKYLDCLESASSGDHRPIIQFFLDRGLDTMGLVSDRLAAAAKPSPDDAASRLHRLFFDRLSHEEINHIGLRLLSSIQDCIVGQFNALTLPRSISLDIPENAILELEAVEGYRLIKRKPQPFINLRIESAPPARAFVSTWIRVLVSLDTLNPFSFLIQANPDKTLRVRLEDAHPEISTSLGLRIQSLAERLLGELLTKIEEQAAESLKK